MKYIDVILADDHVLLRTGLKMLLEKKGRIRVIGEASDGEETLKLLEELEPEIVILDIGMPKLDGIECIKEIKNRGIKTKIIILTMYNEEQYIIEVIRAGAMAYVQKGAVDTELFIAIDAVVRGEIYINSNMTQSLLKILLQNPEEKVEEDNPYNLLSSREREVLRLIAKGYLLKDIANELSLSVKTVDTYKSRIMVKLDFTKKREIVEYALKYHFLSDEDMNNLGIK